MPKFEKECFLSLVTSTRPHAKLVSVDATEALSLPGVITFVSAKDILPENNLFGAIVCDEEVFASTKVNILKYQTLVNFLISENLFDVTVSREIFGKIFFYCSS